ncbi:hypothetical protein DY000_02011643 [Brassica cretica]|uniref:Reverse transcriptase zinc-binding domain-containing protein n=1 Tax=Brassica cretica TaxID=69181 RepID=A0ABQ7D665_BRACR|nr:hypothetical protein DY000_02011643 [Brassica cretica]
MLSCEYSYEVWYAVLRRCQPPPSMITSWSELLSWIWSSPSKKLTLLRKIAVQTVIFHLWKQRNNLIHNQASLSTATVFHGIDREVRNIISARRLRKPFKDLMQMWLR